MSDGALRAAAAAVALAGAGVAGYLTWAHYADTTVFCVAGGGCDSVQSSSYANVGALPVALLGVLAYATVLALVAWDGPVARLAAASLALVGALFGAYLLAVQLFVLDALCTWCVANDVVLAPGLAVLAVARLREPRASY